MEVMDIESLRVATTDLESVLSLRTRFLDPPRSREQALSAGDTAPGCVHFGAYVDDKLVGVCSVGPDALPVLNHAPAWRLRGMVVLPELRGAGIGTVLIKHHLQYIASLVNSSGNPIARAFASPLAWAFAKRKLTSFYSSSGYYPTGYTYMHPVGGETCLFGNEPTLRLIEKATGVSYANGALPELGRVDYH